MNSVCTIEALYYKLIHVPELSRTCLTFTNAVFSMQEALQRSWVALQESTATGKQAHNKPKLWQRVQHQHALLSAGTVKQVTVP